MPIARGRDAQSATPGRPFGLSRDSFLGGRHLKNFSTVSFDPEAKRLASGAFCGFALISLPCSPWHPGGYVRLR